MKANDIDIIKKLRIRCDVALENGKTYKWKDITCTLAMLNIWERYSHIDESFESYVIFNENKAQFIGYLPTSYLLQSKFLGCWQWWSITLLVLLILIVIAVILFFVIPSSSKSKDKKEIPKKASK